MLRYTNALVIGRKENTNSIRQSSAKPDCSIWLANGTFKSPESTLLHLLDLHCGHVSILATQGSAAVSKLNEATKLSKSEYTRDTGLILVSYKTYEGDNLR